VILNPRTRPIGTTPHEWCVLGARVVACPPTVTAALMGTVSDIEGHILTLDIPGRFSVLVDIEDCLPVVERRGW
jgi:hypothetical protein